MFGERKGEIGEQNYQPIFSFSESKGLDTHLRFFEQCTKYVELSKEIKEKKDFIKSHFPKVAQKITKMIGADPHFILSEDNVTLMMELCASEFNINGTKDHFCAFFEREDFELIELFHDISAYYKMGYGWDLSYEIACPLASDIMNLMDKKINGTDQTKAYLRFAHAETVVPLITRLGLFKDPFHISWNTDEATLKTRKWRTSIMATYAANLAFTLYQCPSDYLVEVQLNEGQVAFEKCNNQVFCPLSQFKSMFNFINQCDFHTICETDKALKIQQQQNLNNKAENQGGELLLFLGVGFGSSFVTAIVGIAIYYSWRRNYVEI